VKDTKKKIAFYTLGCKVNQYETQGLKESFMQRGFEITDEHAYADIYVINTCTVTGLADRKSRQYIRRMKRQNPESIVAVIGCYAQVSPEEAAAIAGVDLVIGNNEKNALPDHIEKLLQDRQDKKAEEGPYIHILPREELKEYEESGIITSMESRTRAYIKIQDGCNQFCSYCIIPYARGASRSRACQDIVREAKSLLEKGFKELVLTGINTALYGMKDNFEAGETDVYGIEIIVKQLNDLPGDFRIRLSSLEPTVINASLAKRLLKYDKLCHHMHLSLQSGSDRILQAMNRHYGRKEYLEIVKVLREADPNYGLTTDVIVGFPGETEEDFNHSADMIRQVGFLKTHVFPYSKRQGTRAAEMKEQVDPQTKKARSTDLIKIAEASAHDFLNGSIGDIRKVLFEEYDGSVGMVFGYSDNYIKVYSAVYDENHGQSLLNTLKEVKLTEVYRDGVKGDLWEK
jgi:threonylcarbamoyladenosine tRNA methylthiotransferase MtaB